MSQKTSEESQPEHAKGSVVTTGSSASSSLSTSPSSGHTYGTRKSASPASKTSSSSASPPILQTPRKKSKRQAERSARAGGSAVTGAFAASQRMEALDDRYYQQSQKQQSQKQQQPPAQQYQQSKKRSKPGSTSGGGDPNHKAEASKAVTPSPTQSSSQSSKAAASGLPSTTTVVSSKKRPRPGVSDTHETSCHTKKRQKIVYKAISGPKQPIYGYALELVSLVCNNAFSVMKKGSKTSSKPSNSTASPPESHKSKLPQQQPQKPHPQPPQPHRVLDRPLRGYTRESEPAKERLMRLQLRQRFASATSMGMSPIEFARKLLKLWGGSLQQVYQEWPKTKASVPKHGFEKNHHPRNGSKPMRRIVSSEGNNNNGSSSLNHHHPADSTLATTALESSSSKPNNNTHENRPLPMSREDFKAAIETSYGKFDESIGDMEPRSIHPDVQLGNGSMNNAFVVGRNHHHHTTTNPLLGGPFPHPIFHGSDLLFHNETNETNERIERTKKLKERRQRKKQKEAKSQAATGDATTINNNNNNNNNKHSPHLTTTGTTTTTPGASSSKTKSKRTPRKFLDTQMPILHKDMRLTHPEDKENLNALHCFVRAKLLEVFVVKSDQNVGYQDETLADPANGLAWEPANIVGFRCAMCGYLPKEERGGGSGPSASPMATFFPKSIGEIYRGVCTWQRIHFPACQHMPEDYRNEYKTRKESDLTRGKKAHWIRSAYEMGIRNIDSERSGLTYQPSKPWDLEKVLLSDKDPGGHRRSKGGGDGAKGSKPKPKPSTADVVAAAPVVSASLADNEEHEFELFGTTDFD